MLYFTVLLFIHCSLLICKTTVIKKLYSVHISEVIHNLAHFWRISFEPRAYLLWLLNHFFLNKNSTYKYNSHISSPFHSAYKMCFNNPLANYPYECHHNCTALLSIITLLNFDNLGLLFQIHPLPTFTSEIENNKIITC